MTGDWRQGSWGPPGHDGDDNGSGDRSDTETMSGQTVLTISVLSPESSAHLQADTMLHHPNMTQIRRETLLLAVIASLLKNRKQADIFEF